MQKRQKKFIFPSKRLKKRVVAVALNGKIRLPVLARKLRVPLKKVRRWKQKFQGQIKRRQLPAKKARRHLNLIQALGQRERVRVRIVKLKAALKKA
jgi:hypothetical protein